MDNGHSGDKTYLERQIRLQRVKRHDAGTVQSIRIRRALSSGLNVEGKVHRNQPLGVKLCGDMEEGDQKLHWVWRVRMMPVHTVSAPIR